MRTPNAFRMWGTLLTLSVVVVFLPGCAAETRDDAPSATSATTLSGSVTVDGSSTVLPVSTVVADAFRKAHSGVTVAVQSSGTGGGFQKFCAGGVDIVGASRPINGDEERACQAAQVDYIELPVAFDSLSLVVNRAN